jgi:photosystem II stability/assembly factor-like uncharacterized protein
MRNLVAFVCIAMAAAACKKSGGTGGGGGGGGWLVGSSGLMENLDANGKLGAGYDLGASQQLNSIACRYQGEAWVAGAQGTLLYTRDAGATWAAQAVPATGDLRAIATQDAGPVFVVGDGAFLVSSDTGATWQSLGDAHTLFRSVAAAQQGDTVLAIAGDGGLWQYAGSLAQLTTLSGARTVAVSPDGDTALAAGHGLWRSVDAGHSWQALVVDPALVFDDVRVGEDGTAVAVGSGGAIAMIAASGAVAVQHAGTADLHALHIADPDSVDATGYAAGDGGAVWITHDAGLTWLAGPNVGRTVLGVDEIGFGHR